MRDNGIEIIRYLFLRDHGHVLPSRPGAKGGGAVIRDESSWPIESLAMAAAGNAGIGRAAFWNAC